MAHMPVAWEVPMVIKHQELYRKTCLTLHDCNRGMFPQATRSTKAYTICYPILF